MPYEQQLKDYIAALEADGLNVASWDTKDPYLWLFYDSNGALIARCIPAKEE